MRKTLWILGIFGGVFGIAFLLAGFFYFREAQQNKNFPLRENLVPKKEFSLETSLGQMLIIGFEGTEITPQLLDLMEKIRPGGVLLLGRNIVNKEQTKRLIAELQKISLRTTGVPLFIAVDQEGGIVSRLPWVDDTAQSDLKDFQDAFLVGQKRGRELKEVGVNMNLAPVLDSNRRGDFIFSRSFQKTSPISLELARGLIEGQQQEGVLVVPKHFPGYDGIAFNPESSTIPTVQTFPDTSLFHEIFQRHTLPFVMISHVTYEDIDAQNPFPFSQKGIERLKNDLGHQVLVMSDDLTSPSMIAQYPLSEIGKNALAGGVDILLVGGYPDAAVVNKFYQAMQSELARIYFMADVSRFFRFVWDEAEKYEDIQQHISESAEKIKQLKHNIF